MFLTIQQAIWVWYKDEWNVIQWQGRSVRLLWFKFDYSCTCSTVIFSFSGQNYDSGGSDDDDDSDLFVNTNRPPPLTCDTDSSTADDSSDCDSKWLVLSYSLLKLPKKDFTNIKIWFGYTNTFITCACVCIVTGLVITLEATHSFNGFKKWSGCINSWDQEWSY